VIEDRQSRFVVAHASGRRTEALAAEAIRKVHARSRGQPVGWCSDDGWQAYPKAITKAYREPVRTGRRGRPPLVVPEGVSLTQTIKHRDEHGRLLSVETRASIGAAPMEQPVPVHIERLNGVLRDRLACLTRKTHAFAKSTSTWDALFGMALFEHNWLRAHPALSQPSTVPGRYYQRRTPAMAIGLTDHCWSWPEFLTTKPIVSF
jgi:IS1 family transposase